MGVKGGTEKAASGDTGLSGTDSGLSAVVFGDSKEPQLPERFRRCFFGPRKLLGQSQFPS